MSERQMVELGQLVTGDAKRDAIHIATCPCTAGETLRPGQHIGFGDGVGGVGVAYADVNPIGIVDPFLRRPVMQGQRFQMLLYPNTITSLRHEWTHPAFF